MNLINTVKPAVGMFQETKLYKKGQIKFDEYCIFESIRGEKEGGGLLTMVHGNFQPVMIPIEDELKMSENVLVVEADLGQARVRYINSYGVQETALISEKIEFLAILDQEIENAKISNCLVCIQMDANAKFGKDVINGDPNELSSNGELLLDLITRKSLILVNSTDKCLGIITRERVKGNKTERSVLDYFIVCQDFYSLCVSLLIDEEREYTLTRFYKHKNVTKVVKSDHNPLFLYLNVPWNKPIRKQRTEIYNLRNKKCQEEFFRNTNNSNVLVSSLEDRDVITGGKHWLKCVKTIVHNSFRKIRITDQKENIGVQRLLSKRNGSCDNTVIDVEITEKIYERNRNII